MPPSVKLLSVASAVRPTASSSGMPPPRLTEALRRGSANTSGWRGFSKARALSGAMGCVRWNGISSRSAGPSGARPISRVARGCSSTRRPARWTPPALTAEDVDTVVTVSSTGIATPSLEAMSPGAWAFAPISSACRCSGLAAPAASAACRSPRAWPVASRQCRAAGRDRTLLAGLPPR